MTIGFSRRIYQDQLIRTLELAIHEIFMNHSFVFS